MDTAGMQFDPDRFEFDWERLDDRGRAALVDQAPLMPPSRGILPVILCLSSQDDSLRISARKSLVRILKNVAGRLDPEKKTEYQTALGESALIASHIYTRITPDLLEAESNYLFTALFAFGDHGAFFAFKLLLNKRVDEKSLASLINELPESQQLGFTDQYLQAPPDIRLQYANLFKGILKNIRSRTSVVLYYARLFDLKRDVDPFLTHLDPVLRDGGAVMENEISSESPETFIAGLKALTMMRGRVPAHILVNALEHQGVLKIRLAVYHLIETASKGRYPDLFESVWKGFVRSCPANKAEAVSAFRALVVCGRISLSSLMDRVKKECPGILPDLLNEISELSRISFFFIQDMALNRKKYHTHHFDINQACILGMIKKRPERVIRILSRVSKGGKNETTAFIEKIRQLLLKEAQAMKGQFVMKSGGKGKPRLSILTAAEKKRLLSLGDRGAGTFVTFQDRIMENINLTRKTLSGAVLYFNNSVIKGGDWSEAFVANAWFKRSVFFNVDLTYARFEGVSFDNALFRNVRAAGAVFKDCSFRGARIFNCDFSHGDFTDALFTNARIARTGFKETRLSFASFAHARISAVSFDTASLDHADFSHVKAKFVRFPAFADIRTTGIDYNARKYQIDHLPAFPERVTAEINLLVFCEFIRYGKGKFLNQNKLSLLTAYDIFKPKQADLFQIVPLLIHENIELIGSNPIDLSTPCGIADFQPSARALDILGRYSKKKNLAGSINLNPSIEGLYTMGSIGSLAQTPESDIDYWVCINGESLSGEGLKLLEQKLRMMEILAAELFKTSVTFFIVDIQKVQRNDFGGTSQESSGSAQAWLLKEEFYRTMIHVAGKLPLWAVIPTRISLNYYNMICKRVNVYMDAQRYIDLGDVHSVPFNEYFGASIWQMFKWLKSPFKSVIKMALYEIYSNTYGKSTLLCNQYKNEWMNSGTQLKFARNDSYVAIINKLLKYYRSVEDRQSMDIILTCFFLKLEVLDEGEIDNTAFGIRKILLDDVLDHWGWDRKKVLELGGYRQWPYSEIRELSTSIETYMLSKYDRMNKAFDHPSRKGVMISDQDRERLTRKVDIVYKQKFFKVRKLFLIAVNEDYFSNLHLKYFSDGDLAGKWELFHKDEEISQDHEEPLFRGDRIEQIGAWLIYNHLYKEEAQVGLVPNPTSIRYNDIQTLYKAMSDFFTAELNPAVQFYDATQSLPTVVSVFITINMNAEQSRSVVEDYCTVYANSWGEMFCMPSSPDKSFTSLGLAKKEILSSIGLQTFPANTKIYFPRGKVG